MKRVKKIEFQFIKNTVLIYVWIILTTDGILQNTVKGATLNRTQDTTVPKKFCESTCESKICHDEAIRFKALIDERIDPCDDFFNFACGKYFNSPELISQISDSRSWGMFSMAEDRIKHDILVAINETNSNDPEAFIKMQTFYKNCLDQNEGIDSILRLLKNIGGFPMLLGNDWNETAYDWKETLFKIIDKNIFISFPVYLAVEQDSSDTSRYIPIVMSPYLWNTQNWWNLVNESVIALGADAVRIQEEIYELYDFHDQLYKELLSQAINKENVSIDVLAHDYPSIPWLKLFNKVLNRRDIYIDSSDVVIIQDRKFISNLANLINRTPKRVIANFLAWNVVLFLYVYLPKPFHQLTKKYNVINADTRENFCFKQLDEYFSSALDSLYVRKVIAPKSHEEIKKDVENIVESVKNQFRRNIEKVDWMDSNTKAAALKKLGAMQNLINYEKELLDDEKINELYRELTITPGSFLDSGINVTNFSNSKIYKTLKERPKKISGIPRKRATTFNAEYKYFNNAIDIPAAFLQDFMYSYGRPHYLNFGALGSIIGHEVMHGFDNFGRKFDENGILKDWWSNGTAQKYLQKAQCLIDQYNNLTIPGTTLKVNGEISQNENIADNGGFIAAYYAYNKWVDDNSISEGCLPNLNYTTKQLFWITSAENWCGRDGFEYIKNLMRSDPHAPLYARIIIPFSNIKEFAEDFKCSSGSRMNPEKKCTMW